MPIQTDPLPSCASRTQSCILAGGSDGPHSHRSAGLGYLLMLSRLVQVLGEGAGCPAQT